MKTPSVGDIPNGSTVSHFTVRERIGEGGMGVVYRATDVLLGRDVALKVLVPSLGVEPAFRERFVREARAASCLNHPNICTVYEIGEGENGAFIAMEFVDGGTLRGVISSGAWNGESAMLRSRVSVMRDVADALRLAHRSNIVHRDIKPENILLTSGGMPKLADFGTAKLLGGSVHTAPGAYVGSLAYIAPEQLRGEDVDGRADVFSFGVVFYELLTGRRPFRAEHQAALMYLILNTDPEPLEETVTGLSPSLAHLVHRCLRREPEDRFESFDEVIDILQSVLTANDARAVLEPSAIGERAATQRMLAAVMFTDMVGYSALTERNESLAIRLLEEQRAIVRGSVRECAGTEIDAIGDGLCVRFGSALDGVRAAVRIQRMVHDRNTNVDDMHRLRLRIGIHVGDVIIQGTGVYGGCLNIAARLEPLARPGGICVSGEVMRHVKGSVQLTFRPLPPVTLKNIEEPLELFEVVLPWEDQGRPDPPLPQNEPEPQGSKPGAGFEKLLPSRGQIKHPSHAWRWVSAFAGLSVLLVTGFFGFWEGLQSPPTEISLWTLPPGAQVEINGTAAGDSPVLRMKQEPGSLAIVVHKEGFTPKETTLVLREGDSLTCVFSLLRITAPEVTGSALPAEAPPIKSLTDLADRLAGQLKSTVSQTPTTLAIRPFTYGESGFASEFSWYFLHSLSTSLFRQGGGWRVLVPQGGYSSLGAGESVGAPATFVLSGSYWEIGDSVHVMCSVASIVDKTVIAAGEVEFSRKLIENLALRLAPENIERAERDRKLFVQTTSPPQGAVSLRLWTNKGAEGLVFGGGEVLELYVAVDRPCYLVLVDHLVDGRRAVLKENLRVMQTPPGAPMKLLSLECIPPYGAEVLQCFASEQPFPSLGGKKEGDYRILDDDLAHFLASMRGLKAVDGPQEVSEFRLSLTTIESQGSLTPRQSLGS